MCSFTASVVAASHDVSSSRVAKFVFTPGEGLVITSEGEAPSEARRRGAEGTPAPPPGERPAGVTEVEAATA